MTKIKQVARTITGWGGYPQQGCYLIRPEKYHQLHPYLPHCIARGLGKSYGDASLNAQRFVILTERLNRLLAFDATHGILTAEPGVTLADILSVIVPAGWFLPVTPGTQYVTLGGCVASDVHGKNHHRDGSFGQFVLAFELITADGKKILCTPKEHPDLFCATIGGMGLTGFIGSIVLKLKPLASQQLLVKQYIAQNLDQIMHYLSDTVYDDDYTVAWIDGLSHGKQLGRSIAMMAHHADPLEIPDSYRQRTVAQKTYRVPFYLPGGLLNTISVRLFNNIYFHQQSKKTTPFLTDLTSYFYPLDKIRDWNRLYGKKGFVQYQCVVPHATAFEGIKTLLEKCVKKRVPSFLGVLKRFGPGNQSMLSFPMAGYTLALDIPFREKKTLKFLSMLDDIVLHHQGRVYLAKDARLSPEHFRLMYPRYAEWLAIKQKIDPAQIFQSSLSRRLQLGE